MTDSNIEPPNYSNCVLVFFYRGNRGGLVEGSSATSPPQLAMEAEDSDSPAHHPIPSQLSKIIQFTQPVNQIGYTGFILFIDIED